MESGGGGGLTRQLFLRPEALQAVVPGENQAAAREGLRQDNVRLPLVGERLHAQRRLPDRLEPGQLWGWQERVRRARATPRALIAEPRFAQLRNEDHRGVHLRGTEWHLFIYM